MTRALGFLDAVTGLSDPVVFVFALVTQLGDTWFLVALVTVYFWRRTREDGTFVLAVMLGAFSLIVALKAVFALPRPPTHPSITGPSVLVAFFEFAADADGFGFPSGHALGATAVYGALAVLEAKGDRVLTAALASIIGIIALSRVVIGVHYVVDVLAGVAFGLVFVGLMFVVGRRDPVRAFGLAAVVSVLAVAVTGGVEAFALAGATVGALLVWSRLDVDTAQVPWRYVVPGVAVVGAGWLGAVEVIPFVLVPLTSALVIVVLVVVPRVGNGGVSP